MDIYNRKLEHKNIIMVFGNRWEKDILYRKELEEMESKCPALSLFRFFREKIRVGQVAKDMCMLFMKNFLQINDLRNSISADGPTC
ncbi:MAG: hypothetical protein IPK08_16450 [Bacteroidetes bacterium]|nr:hypothetical protein [Bacteroidota bacterium]